MVPNDPPSASVRRRGSAGPVGDPLRTVVWIRGEHDIATRVHLSLTIAQAMDLDDADLVIDLSGVTFLDASTIGAVVDAHNRLLAQSRSLSVRGPTPLARRLLEVCELSFLVDAAPSPTRPPAAPALDSWVTVPAAGRASSPGDEPSGDPVPDTAPRPVERAGSATRPRASP